MLKPFLSSIVLALLALFPASRAAAQPAAGAIDKVAVEMLQNIHDHGLNPAANGGLGGLWINWRPGTSPLQVNLNGSGAPDGPEVSPPRHDVLTDLRYLHNLLLYKKLRPADPRFDADIARFRKVFDAEWADTHNERGWVYDELIDMAEVSGDARYRQAARNMIAYYATKMIKAPLPIYYKKNEKHPGGYCRVDQGVEAACALIHAGAEFGEPTWSAKGKAMLQFLYDHAYLPQYHVFTRQLDQLLLPDGTANPDPVFFVEGKTQAGAEVRMGEAGQVITALMHVYFKTKDKAYLERAEEFLQPLLPEPNTLGLWDPANLGYFASVKFPGKSVKSPGKPGFLSRKKECARQLHMLEAVMLVNEAAGHRYQALENQLLTVALEKAYDPAIRGFTYEKSEDWKYIPKKNGQDGDWVTTEAIGIGAQVLLKWELHR